MYALCLPDSALVFVCFVDDAAIRGRTAGSVVDPRVVDGPRPQPVPRPVHQERLGPHQLRLRHGRGRPGRDRRRQRQRSDQNTSQHCTAPRQLTTM